MALFSADKSLRFNVFVGTGYFFFFRRHQFRGDWAECDCPDCARTGCGGALLVIVRMASYFGAVLVVGMGLVRYVGVPRNEFRRLRRLTLIPYFSARPPCVCAAGLLNPNWNPTGCGNLPLPATAGAKVRASLVEVLHSERNCSRRRNDRMA